MLKQVQKLPAKQFEKLRPNRDLETILDPNLSLIKSTKKRYPKLTKPPLNINLTDTNIDIVAHYKYTFRYGYLTDIHIYVML